MTTRKVIDTPRPAPPVHPAPVIVPRNQPAPAAPPNPLAPGRQSIYDMMSSTLKAWGLGSLVPYMRNFVTQGMGSSEIQLRLQDTNEWKTRFAGNELRKEKGLAVLTPAQYIATEQAYRQALQQYGLPAGFYDQHSDFTNWIGNDVSPSEVSARAQVAHDQYMNAPDEIKKAWQEYGYAKGDALAAILDPKVATQVIQDRATTVGIGAAAAAQGLGLLAKSRAEYLQEHGTTIQQAQQAFSKIAQTYGTDQRIASRFRQGFDLNDEENAQLLNNGQAQAQLAGLYQQEEGLFNGHSAADSNTVGVSQSY